MNNEVEKLKQGLRKLEAAIEDSKRLVHETRVLMSEVEDSLARFQDLNAKTQKVTEPRVHSLWSQPNGRPELRPQ